MTKPFVMAVRFLLLAVVLTAAAAALAPPTPGPSPYLSALSDLAAPPAMAAHKKCADSACEFVAPAFTCLHESPGTKCGTSSTGCTTLSC
jgi:hypothetical protein